MYIIGKEGTCVTSQPQSIFSLPFEIAAVRTLRQTSREEREAALRRAGFNAELLPQELVYIDLKTDSGVSSVSTSLVAGTMGVGALEAGAEMAPEANAALASLAAEFRELFGFPYLVPVAQGRAAERIWMKLHVRPGSVVLANMLFPSTRFHIESNGAKLVHVISQEAYELFSEDPFKGNIDVAALANVIEQQAPQNVSCVYMELCVNSCGGQPVSMENLRQVQAVLKRKGIPLFLDASRILENSLLVQQREKGYQKRSIRAIVGETCSYADGCTLSALKDLLVREGGFIGARDEKSIQRAYFQSFIDGAQPTSGALEGLSLALKEVFGNDQHAAARVEQVHDLWQKLVTCGIPVVRPAGGHAVFIDVKGFLPHIAPDYHPADALGAFVYALSGIRITKGPPLTREQTARGIELLRLAIPARRYLRGHMDDVAAALAYAFEHRDEIKGLRRVETPQRSKYAPAIFEPVVL
jgi:tyrosine phenol-lyase